MSRTDILLVNFVKFKKCETFVFYWGASFQLNQCCQLINQFLKILGLHLTGRQKGNFFIFHFFILMIFCQRSYKKITFFLKTDVKSSYNLLRSHKNLRSKNFSLRNDCLLKYFVHFHGNAFSLVIFTKWKNYCNSSFKDAYKMCCCYLFY